MMMYLLKLNIALIALFGFYKLMFSSDTFFLWRRASLIGMLFRCDVGAGAELLLLDKQERGNSIDGKRICCHCPAGCNRNTGWWRFDRLRNYGDDYIYYGGLSVLAALLLAVGVHRTAEE